jgi:RAS protein activator-like 1
VSEAEVRESSVEMLQGYLSSVVESIVGSVAQCPPVMRVAFKQLHKRVEEQFPEPENEVSLTNRSMVKCTYKGHRDEGVFSVLDRE